MIPTTCGATAQRFLAAIAVTICSIVALPEAAKAGNGTFDAGEFNYCASVRFNASAAQLSQIRTAFQNGSQVLADATDGQQRFGTITIVNDSGASQSAEYWVNAGAGRAYATLGKYGNRGQHVNLYFDSDFQASNGSDGDAYTIAHEHAHHAYGVADEYSGPGGNAEDAPFPDTATLNYSLMDNYFARGGRAFGGGYTLNEFCVASNHDPDGDTFQTAVNGQSVWEVIDSHPRFSATAPAGLPVDSPPAPHVVTFVDGFGGLRIMLLIDRSGSMSIGQRLDFAKLGAKQFVFFVDDGDGLGVASFASSGSVNFPLTTVDDTARASAKAAINSLVASGATNIGGGLLAALGEITAESDRSCNEIIVLLSDGDQNTGTPPSAVIPQLQAEGVTVLTVGVGSGLSASGEATLQSVATQTGGKFFRVSNAFQLVGLFLRLAAESIGSGLLTNAPETIATGEDREIPILVEAGTESVVFAVTFADSTDDIMLSLITPSGVTITESDALSNPDIDFIAEPNSLIFRISAPEEGTWDMVLTAGLINTGAVEIVAFAEHDGVQLNLAVADNAPVFPEPAIITATPTFEGASVIGASVFGTVIRPDGSELDIVLHDDGLIESFDTIADDGTYSAGFDTYNEDGTYVFELTVEASGTTFPGEDLFAGLIPPRPSNAAPVPEFTRTASTTAVVTGVPQFVVAIVEYGPETINLKSKGKFVTAYIEMPEGFLPDDIAVDSVEITAIDGIGIVPIPANLRPSELGDFDDDGIPDLMVKFDRSELQDELAAGMREIQLEGLVAGEPFVATRSVGVIMPGN